MALAAIRQLSGGNAPVQAPLPFGDDWKPEPRLRVVKSSRIVQPPPTAFFWDGNGVHPMALKYRDGESNASFGSWIVPGNGYRDLATNEDGYARAYMQCVWAFRAINVRVQKIAEVLRRGEVVDKASGKPLPDHALMVAFDLAYRYYQQDVFEDWLLSKALYGESYVELVSAYPLQFSFGVPRTMRVLNALGIEPIIQRGMIAGFTYDGDDGKQVFGVDTIAFDKYRNPLDDVRGLSLLTAAMDSINIDRTILIFTRAHLKNNARPGLIFTPKEGRLSQADVDLIQTTLSEDVKGAANAGNPLLMPTAFDVTQAAAPPMDDMNALSDYHKRRICSAIGVPVALVDYTDMAFQLSPEQNKTFYELTVIPDAEKIARVINTQVLSFFDPSRKCEFKLPLDNIRAGLADPKTRTEIANARLQGGGITLNEWRAELDLTPVPDGDVRFLPMGVQIVKAGELGLPAPAPVNPFAPALPPVIAPPTAAAQAEPARTPEAVATPSLAKAVTLSDEAKLEIKNWRIVAGRKGRDYDFVPTVLANETVAYIKTALKGDVPLETLFDHAREVEIEALKKKALTPYASPDEYLEYWGDYDKLMAEIGDDWLTEYMGDVLAEIESADTALTVDQITRLLEARRGDLVEQWLGTEDKPGSLARVILAGMGAGQVALEKNQSIDPDKAAKAVTLSVDWNLLSKEATEFIRNYAFNLIRNINQTTVEQVQDAIAKWAASGDSLDTLKQSLTQVFGNRARAALIAQTETTRAYNEGANQRWRDAGVTKAKWQTVVDSHVCPICEPLHNQVGMLGQGWKSSKGYVHPPAHPGCRCFSKPVLDAAPDDLEAQAQNVLDRLEERARVSAAAAETRKPEAVEYQRLIAYDKVESFAQSQRSNIQRLNEAQTYSIKEYSGSDYRPINDMTRGTFPKNTTDDTRIRYEQHIKNLDEALARSQIQDNIIVYRGVRRSGISWLTPDHPEDALGVQISDAGFMSTSIDDSVVDQFADKGGAVFEIRVPRGSNGMFIRDISNKPEESEVLLPRNTRMRVVEIRPHDYLSGVWQIVLEVIQ